MPSSQPLDPLLKSFNAGILAWVLPGAGHFYLGLRSLGWVFFTAITFAFVVGLAIGGVKTSINPQANVWLFLAELPLGLYTTVGYLVANILPTPGPNEASPYVSYFPESDIAQIYLAVAGLLNLIVILDAITRAQTDGLPVFHPELEQQRLRDEAAAQSDPDAAPQDAAAPASAQSDSATPAAPPNTKRESQT